MEDFVGGGDDFDFLQQRPIPILVFPGTWKGMLDCIPTGQLPTRNKHMTYIVSVSVNQNKFMVAIPTYLKFH